MAYINNHVKDGDRV